MSASSRSEPSRGPLRSVAHWAPVWLPLALGIQIAILGLRPALQEERRLEGEREALRARQAELLAERAELAAATDEVAERAAFFRGWTRKEAALKAIGTGFHREPASLHIGLEPRRLSEPWVPDSDFVDFGMLTDLPAPDGFAAAVAAEGTGWRVVEAG